MNKDAQRIKKFDKEIIEKLDYNDIVFLCVRKNIIKLKQKMIVSMCLVMKMSKYIEFVDQK